MFDGIAGSSGESTDNLLLKVYGAIQSMRCQFNRLLPDL
jgi:hypothetical protein